MLGLMVCWEVRTRRADSGGGRPSGVRLLSSRRKLSGVESQSSTEFVTGKVARVSSSLFGIRLLLSYRESPGGIQSSFPPCVQCKGYCVSTWPAVPAREFTHRVSKGTAFIRVDSFPRFSWHSAFIRR